MINIINMFAMFDMSNIRDIDRQDLQSRDNANGLKCLQCELTKNRENFVNRFHCIIIIWISPCCLAKLLPCRNCRVKICTYD
jgi:hypothetical protein